MQAGLDDGRYQAAIVSSNSFNPLRVHFVVLFRFRPVESGIALLANQQVGEVDLLEFELDGLDEFSRHQIGSLSAC